MKLALWAYEAPAHVGATKASASLSGVHTVLRAPKGDGYATIMLAMFERLGAVPPLSICALTEATLAGASANIPAHLVDLEKRRSPEVIFITRSATAAVLQEPLDGEIAMMPPGTVRAEIIEGEMHPVRDTESSAFDVTLRQLVRTWAKDIPKSERPSVNILGPSLLGFHDHANVRSMRTLLGAVGIDVNVVAPLGASKADVERIGAAWANISLAHELTERTTTYLQKRFGTPTIQALPYGEAGTTRFLRELCGLLEIDAARIADAARASQLMWYARTVDAHALSHKRIGVFGSPTTAAGIARVLSEELDMRIAFVGTYVTEREAWLRDRVGDLTDDVFATSDYREVAARIDEARPDMMFGSQMERHASSQFGVPCAVISPPVHILNFPLGYQPFVGYDGANHIADLVNTTQVLGLEHHLIEMFGPRNQGQFADAMPERHEEAAAPVAVAAASATAVADAITWTPSGESLIARVPFFVRKKARANIERYAREFGIAAIDERVVVSAREHIGG
jgi:light-independent protochlorophyllide reductase subunit B